MAAAWIGVGSDGTVHVMYYDTRQNSARTSVDIYYSKSTDGGNTWSAPVRATSVTSPHIEDSFQWGDYNGLDVLGSQVIGIFTDNRSESDPPGDSVDVYVAGSTDLVDLAGPVERGRLVGTTDLSASLGAAVFAIGGGVLYSATDTVVPLALAATALALLCALLVASARGRDLLRAPEPAVEAP